MRLIECNIQGFGCLVDYHYTFNEKLNSLCEDNGFGKSTLAAFIRVMFYGFEGEKNKKLEDRERTKYYPWTGKYYGGSITFEVNGKSYVIYRTFGDRAKDDKFVIKDAETFLESTDFSEEIGKEIFNIDSDSYFRSAFITQMDCVTKATDDINSKIGNLTDDTNDLNNYEKIMSNLNDQINALSPSRKTGKISKIDDDITRLKKEINDESSLDEQIDNVIEMRDSQNQTIEKLRAVRAHNVELQGRVAATADREHYEDIVEDLNKAQAEYDEVRAKLSHGIPEDSEMTKAIGDYSSYVFETNQANEKQFTDEKEARYELLGNRFKSGFSAEEYSECRGIVNRIEYLENFIASKQISDEEREELSKLTSFFGRRLDPAGESNDMRKKWGTAETKRESLFSKKEKMRALLEERADLTKSKGANIPLIICAVIAVLIGVFTLLIPIVFAGIPLIIVGIVLLTVGLKKKTNGSKEDIANLDNQINTLELEIKSLESEVNSVQNEIKAYLSGYGYSEESDISVSFQEIYERALQYGGLIRRADESGCEKENAEVKTNKAAVAEYLRRYGMTAEDGHTLEVLESIKTDNDEYNKILQELEDIKGANARALQAKSEFLDFLNKYGIDTDGADSETVGAVRDIKVKIEAASNKLSIVRGKKEEFEREHDVTKFISFVQTENMPSLKELNDKIDSIDESIDIEKQKLDSISRELEELMSRLDAREENRELLEEKENEKAEGMKKFNMLKNIRSHIENAKLMITAKYSHSVNQRLAHYLEILREDATLYKVDAEANVTFEAAGLPRDTRFLSAGYQDLVGLCLRLAFVDSMFEDEKPFLILDDPFVNLDKNKMEAGLKLLNEISEEYQVIYFTCHESRNS